MLDIVRRPERAAANEPLTFRQPPHNLEAEQALLGAILVNNEALDRVSGFLSPDHFFDPLHGRIFETLATLIHAGKTATPITVKTFFENVEPIDANMTVPQYLGRLVANATTIINAAEYGRLIIDLSTRRAVIVAAEDVIDNAYTAPAEFDAIDQLNTIDSKFGLIRSFAERAYAPEQANILEFASEVTVDTSNTDLVKGMVPSRAALALYGPSGSGKTFYAIDVVFHIATGKSWRGRRVRRVPVLYIALEGQAGFGKRVKVAIEQIGDPGPYFARLRLSVNLSGAEANKASEELISRACDLLERRASEPVGLIVVDTFARAMAGDNENDAAAVNAALSRIDRVCRQRGATCMLIHHPGKDQSLGLRGSSALFAALDVVIRIDREKDATQRTVTLEKSKDGVEGLIESFTLSRVSLGVDDDGDEITSCSILPTDAVEAAPSSRPTLPPAAQSALAELHELLIAERGDKAKGHARIPDGVTVIKLSDWRAACRDRSLSTSGEAEAEKKAFGRAVDALEKASFIARFGDFVWLLKGHNHG